jgi:hypothetical protein
MSPIVRVAARTEDPRGADAAALSVAARTLAVCL